MKKGGDDSYFIGFKDCPMYWEGGNPTIRNAELRCGRTGNKFWIRPQGDRTWAIGFGNCPLFWRSDRGDTKNAEFRCGESIKDFFWIKGGTII